ncbi:threonine-phosphate decarboxylase CobD [Pseudomonas sp. BMS12]|uniref:threonine-phosphate decarboxylase CobD n=1 Tax=Pseudomonas sp. BMS12 TaxID=1796033 RepID=UPI000839FDCA|nr:threonine-phosphate decarboxylase CobD [Pseudomonas sp. BMS12]
MLEHGGRVRLAAQQFGIELNQWLDLSTGIAPYAWPLPVISADAWNRLPEKDDGLEAAARDYYGVQSLLPVAGSQAAIQLLPRLRGESRVGIVAPAYAEHAQAWRREGHRLQEISEGSVHRALERLDVLVVINPNNPTGRRIEVEQLLSWHAQLAERGGWLVVDEAFIDCTPELSLAAHSHLPGLVVLRSFGKFFGLAGMRLGFVLAEADLLQRLDALLGPWTVAGPTREVARAALLDGVHQEYQRQRLQADGLRLAVLLSHYGLPPAGGTSLFQLVLHERPPELHAFLAQRGILVRLINAPSGLRFGLPGDETGWARLEQALKEYRS